MAACHCNFCSGSLNHECPEFAQQKMPYLSGFISNDLQSLKMLAHPSAKLALVNEMGTQDEP
jgi:hypothetical protein